MKTLFKLAAIAAVTLMLSSCKKDTIAEPQAIPQASSNSNNLNLLFEAMVDTNTLELSTQTYTNQAGNTFNVTMYKYYISNIKITKTDNTIWTEPNSYHLVDHADAASTLITIANVPFGNYKAIEFMIGVDSARNNSGAQTGALDPANGMFWSWSTGYIMAKMEGTSPQSSATGQNLKFHIGGFSGTNNTIKLASPTFNGDTAKVSSSISPTIHLSSNLLQWFQTPNSIDFSIINTVHMPGLNATKVADNYADMFMVEHIHND